MSHRVKVGDKIKILLDYAVGTTEIAGTILNVTKDINAAGVFETNCSDNSVFSSTWAFSELDIDAGLIELVQPNDAQEVGPGVLDFIEQNKAYMKELSEKERKENELSTFERDRLSYMKNQCANSGWIQVGKSDINMFDKILRKL